VLVVVTGTVEVVVPSATVATSKRGLLALQLPSSKTATARTARFTPIR
jgi:hypothetical protein